MRNPQEAGGQEQILVAGGTIADKAKQKAERKEI